MSAMDEVYTGVWGYNTVLVMAALGANFYPVNAVTFLQALLASFATSVAQFALRENMTLQVKDIS